jgi:hypothetical protein
VVPGSIDSAVGMGNGIGVIVTFADKPFENAAALEVEE